MRQKSFWYACDMLLGPSAVMMEWKQLAGDQFQAARAFLRPTDELATSYPCTWKYPCGCYHQVVIHSDDNIVAVCCCEPVDCDKIHLTKSDIISYELDHPALYRAMAKTLPLEIKDIDVPYLRRTNHVGFYIPRKGIRLPVFFTTQIDARDFSDVVMGLLSRNREPFLLMAPTSNLCEPECLELLEDRGSLFLTLSDVFVIDESGAFVVDEFCVETLKLLCARAGISEPNELQPVCTVPPDTFDYDEDYRIIALNGRKLEPLSKAQSEVVRLLHKAFESGHPEMRFGSIAVQMTAPPTKMSHIFKSNDERKSVIKRVKTDIYRLNI